MAIEDALIMSSVLSLVYDSADIPKAFNAYDTIRRPRTQKLVTTSREGGELYEMQLPNVGDNEDKIREQLTTRMKWIWDIDLEAQVEEAKELVRKEMGSN